MLICNDFANDLTDGIASPAFNSPLIIAALICDAICSYKGRLALLLTTISKFPPPFRSLVLCCYKYSIKRKSTDVKRVNYKKQAKRLCSVCFLQFIWTWNSVWLSFKFVCYFMAHEHSFWGRSISFTAAVTNGLHAHICPIGWRCWPCWA